MATKNKTQDVPKKCFCARCFLPIDEREKVEIDGQNFHKMCGTCCICRTIPAKLKMFYGHVFCEECFKTFVLARFRGENPQMQVDSWWMQFAPGVKAQEKTGEDTKPTPPKPEAKDAPNAGPNAGPEPKRCICARCLQAVEDGDKVEIGGQPFHCNCARCCSCHQVPKDNIKIYCGQVFCEECFHRHILNRNKDNPTEFFNSCFEQWKTNPQFGEGMKKFMESSTSGLHAPLVFMTPPPSYRCSAEREAGWKHSAESKSATPATTLGDNSWGLGNITPVSDQTELGPESLTEQSTSANESAVAVAEKIEKLTKYLCETSYTETPKKWKTTKCEDNSSLAPIRPVADWGEMKRPDGIVSSLNCPKCLWQSGTIYVNRD